jgi:hypothetical protein
MVRLHQYHESSNWLAGTEQAWSKCFGRLEAQNYSFSKEHVVIHSASATKSLPSPALSTRLQGIEAKNESSLGHLIGSKYTPVFSGPSTTFWPGTVTALRQLSHGHLPSAHRGVSRGEGNSRDSAGRLALPPRTQTYVETDHWRRVCYGPVAT